MALLESINLIKSFSSRLLLFASTSSQNCFHQLQRSLMSIASDYITTMAQEEVEGEGRLRRWISMLSGRILLYYSYLFAVTIRSFIVLVLFNSYSEFLPQYFTFDPIMNLLHRANILDGNLALVMCPIGFLMIYGDFLVSFTQGYRAYFHIYDLLVLNRENFYRLNPQLNSWKSLLSFVRQKNNNLSEQQQVKLKWHQLLHLGPIDHSIRVRAIALAAIFDQLLAVTVVFMALLCPLAVYFFSFTLAWNCQNCFSLLQRLVIFIDGFLMLYSAWHTCKIGFTFVYFVHQLFGVQLEQQRAFDRRLGRLLILLFCSNKFSQKRNYVCLKQQPQQTLTSFFSTVYLHRHRQLIDDMLTFDRQVASQILFNTLLGLFGFNVYCVSIFTLKTNLSLFERSFIIAFVFIMSTVVFLGLRPLKTAHQVMHSPADKLLYKSVECLNSTSASSPHLILKLKLSTYYQVLTTGSKLAFSAGPLGKITSKSLFEFCVVYVAYLLFAFNLIFRN